MIRGQFGERVAAIVVGCTDGTQESKAAAVTQGEKRADWVHRKREYLAHLEHASDDVLRVSGCDKLHNARAILTDLHDSSVGEAVFDRFTSGRNGTLWYYHEIARILTKRKAPMAAALESVVAEMCAPAHLSEAAERRHGRGDRG